MSIETPQDPNLDLSVNEITRIFHKTLDSTAAQVAILILGKLAEHFDSLATTVAFEPDPECDYKRGVLTGLGIAERVTRSAALEMESKAGNR